MAESNSELEQFLTGVNPAFRKYAEKLVENGLTTTDDLGVMQDEDFKYLGIPLFHWRQIVSKARKSAPSVCFFLFACQRQEKTQRKQTQETPEGGSGGGGGGGGTQPPSSSPQKLKSGAAAWGVEEVALWVKTLEDGQYADYSRNFSTSRIDGSQLVGMTGVKDLNSVVPDLGARYGIYQCIEDLQVECGHKKGALCGCTFRRGPFMWHAWKTPKINCTFCIGWCGASR